MTKFFGFLLGVAVACALPAAFGVLAAEGGVELSTKELALAYGIGALLFWGAVSISSGAAALGATLAFGTMIYAVHWIPNRTNNFLNDVPGVTTGMIEGLRTSVLSGLVPVLAVISLIYAIQLIVRAVRRRRLRKQEQARLAQEQAAAAQAEEAEASQYADPYPPRLESHTHGFVEQYDQPYDQYADDASIDSTREFPVARDDNQASPLATHQGSYGETTAYASGSTAEQTVQFHSTGERVQPQSANEETTQFATGSTDSADKTRDDEGVDATAGSAGSSKDETVQFAPAGQTETGALESPVSGETADAEPKASADQQATAVVGAPDEASTADKAVEGDGVGDAVKASETTQVEDKDRKAESPVLEQDPLPLTPPVATTRPANAPEAPQTEQTAETRSENSADSDNPDGSDRSGGSDGRGMPSAPSASMGMVGGAGAAAAAGGLGAATSAAATPLIPSAPVPTAPPEPTSTAPNSPTPDLTDPNSSAPAGPAHAAPFEQPVAPSEPMGEAFVSAGPNGMPTANAWIQPSLNEPGAKAPQVEADAQTAQFEAAADAAGIYRERMDEPDTGWNLRAIPAEDPPGQAPHHGGATFRPSPGPA
ncbi:hypothetical protein [Kribbella deserti]|uniref:MFS transporter n=1 Tax=Kribbella deserti TaxID=1926257 RepID=A0ABV6QUF5_9ACTN